LTRPLLACALLGALTLIVTGCSSSSDSSDYAQYWTALKRSWQGSFGTVRVTREEAAAIPYASMGYRVDDGAERIIILATDTHGERLWTSADHIVLLTRGGQIIRTVGLAQDLGGTNFRGNTKTALPAAALHHDVSVTRYADFPDKGLYSVPIVCHAHDAGAQDVTILGHDFPATRITQVCNSERLNWSFTDTYWINESGELVLRSIQHITPKTKIETEILRPPG
jgi:hypothetical protein